MTNREIPDAAVEAALDAFCGDHDWADDFNDEIEKHYEAMHRALIASGEFVAGVETALTAAAEQRCERNTPWDAACLAIMGAIRALADDKDLPTAEEVRGGFVHRAEGQ